MYKIGYFNKVIILYVLVDQTPMLHMVICKNQSGANMRLCRLVYPSH